MTRRFWTTQELQRAAEYYKSHTVEETASHLGRSKASVANAFLAAGIQKTSEEKARSMRCSRDRYRIQRDELAKALRDAGQLLKVGDKVSAYQVVRAALVKADRF